MAEERKLVSLPAHPIDRDWTKPAESDPSTLHELMLNAVGRYSEKPLFGFIPAPGMARQHLTYQEFGDIVDACARTLRDRGIGPGDRIAMILDNCFQWAALAYAVNGLGGVFTAMYTHQNGAEWAYIIDDSGPSMLACANTRVLDRLAGREHARHRRRLAGSRHHPARR